MAFGMADEQKWTELIIKVGMPSVNNLVAILAGQSSDSDAEEIAQLSEWFSSMADEDLERYFKRFVASGHSLALLMRAVYRVSSRSCNGGGGGGNGARLWQWMIMLLVRLARDGDEKLKRNADEALKCLQDMLADNVAGDGPQLSLGSLTLLAEQCVNEIGAGNAAGIHLLPRFIAMLRASSASTQQDGGAPMAVDGGSAIADRIISRLCQQDWPARCVPQMLDLFCDLQLQDSSTHRSRAVIEA